MSDDEPASEIDRLLDAVFEREGDHRPALEALCEEHPEHAEELRKRVARLETHGVLESAVRPPTLPGIGDRFGPWRLTGVLGRGAMGIVFEASREGDEDDGERVALKLILPSLAQGGRERFDREAVSLQSVEHPNVCRLIDFGEIDGTPWIAMERVVGPSLADRVFEARGDLGDLSSPADVARIGVQLARGLAASHAKGVVHRDVKPANVLLRGGEEPVLIDFGLARHLGDERITQTHRPIGTPAYMAPEQVRGDDVDARSDVYALGAVLFELLTLRPPFDSASREDLFRRILSDDVESPRRRNPSIPRPLVHIVWKCLEKEPRRRYVGGAELADDLERFLSGRSVVARPPGPFRLAARRVRRHPVTVLGVVALALAFGLLVAMAKNDRLVRRAYAGSLLAGLYSQRYGDAEALAVAAEAYTRYPSLQTRSQFYRLLIERRVSSIWTADGANWLHAAPSPDGTTLAIAAAPDQDRPYGWVKGDGGEECPFERVLVAQGGHVEWDAAGERVAVLVSRRGVRVLEVADELRATEYRLQGSTQTRSFLRPARCIAFDARGDLWVGTSRGRLSRLRDGEVERFAVFSSRSDVLAVDSEGPWIIAISRRGEIAVVDELGDVVARPVDLAVLREAGLEPNACDRVVIDLALRRLVVARAIDRETRGFDCRLEVWKLPSEDKLLESPAELVMDPIDLQDRSVDLCIADFGLEGGPLHAALTRTGVLWLGDQHTTIRQDLQLGDSLSVVGHDGRFCVNSDEGRVVLVGPNGGVESRFSPRAEIDLATGVYTTSRVTQVVSVPGTDSALALCWDGALASFELQPKNALGLRPKGDLLFAARWGPRAGEIMTGAAPHRFGRWSRNGDLLDESFLGLKPGMHRIAVARRTDVVVAAIERVLDPPRRQPSALAWLDPETMQVQQRVLGAEGALRWRDLAFTPDEKTLFAVDGNRVVRLRRVPGSTAWKDLALATDDGATRAFERVTATDTVVVTAGQDGDVEVFDHDGKPIVSRTFDVPPSAIAAWNNVVYVGLQNGRVLVLTLADLSEIAELETHPWSVNRIALLGLQGGAAARPTALAIGGAAGFVSIHRGPEAARWLEFDAPAGVVDLDWNVEGDELLVATSDGRVRVLPLLGEDRLRKSAQELVTSSE